MAGTRLRIALLAATAALASPGVVPAATCPGGSIADQLAAADVAFVGRVLSIRPLATGTGVPQFDYRFVVDQGVKGTPAREVTVRAVKLVDIDGKPLTPTSGVAVGVLASGGGGRLATSSCGLVDAGSLLGAADAPKGGGIKVAIGLVILALVLAYSVRRLKRRSAAPPRPGPLG